ncbi:MAG: DNA repair protein RadC, partial [Rubrivivax sp.]
MSIKDLPLNLRPRERLLTCGAQALAPEELLAVLLRTGMPGLGVLDLASTLLRDFKGLAGLLAARPQDLKRVKGLGPAKRAEIVAVMELARRAAAQELGQASVFNSPAQLKQYAALHLAPLEHESFSVIHLDTHHRLIELQTLFRGTLSQASVYPREVVKEALARNAAAVVLAHNHPSGVAEPSRADEFLTQTLKSALQLVDVRVLDHLVVGHGQVVSFAERGLL